jgi:uncharacterized protein YjaG (DUF416 family)
MMMTFKEFVEKFNEAVPDPKEVEKYAQNPEVQAVANDPNKLKQIVIKKEMERKKKFSDAIKNALASVPPTP